MHSLNLDALTVIYTAENGESYDLNAGGAPCASFTDLREFIAELHEQGAFDADTCADLMADLAA